MKGRLSGALIAQEQGESNAYGMFKLQDRGQFFIKDQVKVYGGQIVGIHTRDNDLIVNPSKAKQLNNIRTHAADEKLILSPPLSLTLEEALEFINDDELVEVDAQGDPPAQARPRPQPAQGQPRSAPAPASSPASTS